MCMFCRLLFVLLFCFCWPLCCLFFFALRILITPLPSSILNEYVDKAHIRHIIYDTIFYLMTKVKLYQLSSRDHCKVIYNKYIASLYFMTNVNKRVSGITVIHDIFSTRLYLMTKLKLCKTITIPECIVDKAHIKHTI